MYLTLILVVFFGSIVVFFAQEFSGTFKKIFAIKGMILLIPLAVASWAVYAFDYWVLWAIYYYRELLQAGLYFLQSLIPFQKGSETIALVVLLTAVSVIPVLALDFILRKRTFKGYQYPYVTSTLILIITTVSLLVAN